MADNLPPSSADVTESGSLNLPEPSGPHRPVMGLLYLHLYIIKHVKEEYISKLERLEIDKSNEENRR
jgi:hypothetical protein